LLAGANVTEAAAAAGMSERTAYRRLGEPGFREQLAAARKAVVSGVVARLAGSAEKVVAVMLELIESDCPPKGGKTATIELTPSAREVLLELRQESSSGFVFTNAVGGSRQPRDVQRAFTKARDRAALPSTEDGPVVFHSLRHTGISRLANHPEIPLVHVRDFARHSDLATTQGYVHKIESEMVTLAIAEALSGERGRDE
jgi:integrase